MPTTNRKPRRRRLKHPKGFKTGRGAPSKMVIHRIVDTKALRSSIDVYEAVIAESFDARLSARLRAGETLPDQALMLDLVARSIEAALESLVGLDRRYADRVRQCRARRRECDQVARQEVYPQVVKLRRSIDANFGKEAGLAIHGLEGKTRRKASRQRFQIERMVLLLKDRSRELPPPKVEGLTVDRDAWLRQIEPPFRKLEKLYGELLCRERQRDVARDQRNAAMTAFDAEYGEVLRFIEGAFGLGGCGRRAIQHLRPIYQRRRMGLEAKEKREARAKVPRRLSRQTVRSTVSSITSWLARCRPGGRRGSGRRPTGG